MPTRADLARWILHVARNKTPLTGASDHAVSEAFYLDDPEGNGIEVYHDRPADSWEWTGDALKITTDPLDVDDILREVPPTAGYDGAPDGLRIGHVHLRVGDVARAEAFYRDGLGLDVTRRRHGASFMSSGRYHHHIAGNVWHSAGAGARDEDRAGLSWFSLEAADDAAFEAAKSRLAQAGAPLNATPTGIETADPWGTRLRIERALKPSRLRCRDAERAQMRSSASAASFFVSSPAGSARPSEAACPAHIGEKSPEPCASALARSGASAPAASGKSGATSAIGPISRITRLMMPRAGRPVIRLVTAVASLARAARAPRDAAPKSSLPATTDRRCRSARRRRRARRPPRCRAHR